MRTLSCPHCHHAIKTDDDAARRVVCPACGLSFELEQEPRITGSERPGEGQHKLARFDLLEKLGHGGQGTVYKAWDPTLKRVVALKVPKQELLGGREESERFLREAHSVSQLRHPGIVPVFEVCRDGETPVLVSEFIQGVTLDTMLDTIARSGLNTPRELARWRNPRDAAELIAACADAVHYAHEHGVVHRDLKPGNLILDEEGRPRLMDFGLAKKEAGVVTMTLDGQVLGTPAYMAPEQARGDSHRVDRRADVYSLGVILYELLTGERPFRGNREMLLYQVLNAEPPNPRSLNHLVPRDLETCCLKCLQKEPKKRYQTAKDLADDLRRFLRGEAIQARPVGRIENAGRWCRRKPSVAALIAAIFILIVGSSAATVWYVKDRGERDQRAAVLASEIEGALQEAATLGETAWTLTDKPHLWESTAASALSAAKRAGGLAAGNEALLDESLLGRIEAVRGQLEADERDRRFVKLLERIRLQLSEVKDGRFPYEETLRKYRAAFAARGLTLRTVPPADAAALIKLSRPAVQAALVAALDDWLSILDTDAEKEGPWLREVLALGDTNPWRTEVRAAWGQRDSWALEKLADHESALRQPPASLDLLGNSLFRLHAEASSVRLLKRIQERYPADFWINHTLAWVLHHSRPPQLEEATTYYRIASALQPENAGVLNNLGPALLSKGDLRGAVAVFRRAIELDPKDARTYFNLGNSLLTSQDLNGAIDAYRKAIDLDPKLFQAYGNLGHALLAKGDRLGAIAACRKAVELDPKSAQSHSILGTVLQDTGDFVEAIAEHHKAIELDPKDRQHPYNLGRALGAQGKLSEAIAVYEKALELDPNYAQAYCNLGSVLGQQGRFAESLAAYRRGHELGSKQPGWSFPSAKWVTGAEVLVDLDGRLMAILKGEAKPADVRERLKLAQFSLEGYKRLFAASARFYEEAFAAEPPLADDMESQHRYNAACAAALAGTGQGKDDPLPDDQAKTRWRKQALDWLRADLSACRKQLADKPEARPDVQKSLRHWQADKDLAGVRDAESLAKLPAEEQEAWKQLWQEAATLLEKVIGSK